VQYVTGYLKLSIAILGPHDKLKQHDPVEERAREAQSDNRGMLLVPPNISRWR
jgi:hypothetical protein